ncbi:protein ALWAYS EARLY 3-like isoform X2 [Salvia miltiorrhiza]|uniref:protein ALWAYS EARLY 3-like isoform X2 n=1 Tax=Salvia miltiorrhiza TaxID=226208 RepID=UPI0025ACDB58|nr:protein ALWAYS EARLY 3-like isoform X2 [Salvia miltiorrhiza]
MMGPPRKSRSVNRRYTHEDSPSKDDDSTKRSNGRKRKLTDMLGPRWTTEELSRFYDAYRKYNKDWKKIGSAVRNRSPEMVEALYTMNKAYLSLPHGTASSDGLIAMMTDHYCNLAGSDSDLESNDGTGSSRKIQKRARGKVQPTTSKASDDQFVSHSPVTVPDYGFLSLLKKKRSGGSRPCAVGKRTPRFPVSFPSERFNAESNVSPRRPGLKLKANANDDEVAQEIAIALAEASQKGGSSKVSRTPSKIAESVMSSPFRYAQRKHSLAEMTSHQNAALDEEELEGSTEADTGELSRYKPSVVKEKTKKLKGKNYEIGNNGEHLLDDIKEECSGTEEGQRFGAMKGNFHVEVTDTKISRSSVQSQRKKSKKVLFGKDDAPAFDALQTLADLSLMMPLGDEDDSRLQFKDDPVDELLSTESLPMNQKKEKRRYSVVRMKGHKPISSSEIAPSKTSKPGKASAIGSVPEEDQDLQLAITKTPRRKQKMQASKDGDPGKKLMNRSKKSSQSGSPHLLRNSENSSSADIRKEACEPAQSVAHVPVAHQVNLPTKVRSRRKMDLKERQKLLDKVSNDQSDPSIASVHDRALNSKKNMSICLSNPRLRRWCTYEWFYSAIDYPWFAKREFVEYLYHVGLGHVPRLTRVEWGVIRSSLGKPRRFSEQFLKEEKDKLNQYRDSVRKHYTELREGVREGLPTDLARPLSVGQRVIAIHPKTREVHDGSVLTVDHSRCRVQFDRHELGVEFVMDIDCMPLNPLENLPIALVGKKPISADRFFENFNELKVGGRIQECMKLCPGDKVDATDDISHLSLSADPATLLNQTKVSTANTNMQMRIGSAETADYQQMAYSQPSALAQIQAKEADVQALAELTRALEKKEAVVQELRRMNDDVSRYQIDGDSPLKDSEPFKKQYAAVLVQLNEANEQVSSALYCLRQRNTYQGNMPLLWSRPGTNFADPGGEFSLDRSACQTIESGPHVNEIIDSSRTKARAMVDAAMQAMSSLKCREDTTEKIEEAIDYVNDRLPSDDSSTPMAPNPKATSASDSESQIPFELISKCVATLLMIQKCTQRQFPPSDVAQILDSAVTSLQPRSSQNLPVYTEIQKCMGIIRNQIMALIPT